MDYANLVKDILADGVTKNTRNGKTKSLFGLSLVVDNLDLVFPVIQGRKIYYKGVSCNASQTYLCARL